MGGSLVGNLARLLAVGVLIAGVAAGIYVLTQSRNESGTRIVRARFDRTGNLLEGNPVRVGGVQVGTIKTIKLDPEGNGVIVSAEVPDDQTVYANAEARIRSVNLVGERYLDVLPGGQPEAELPGKVVDLPLRGVVPISLDDFAGQLSTFVAEDFDRFLDEANAGLNGRSEGLKGTISSAIDFSGTLADTFPQYTPAFKRWLDESDDLMQFNVEHDAILREQLQSWATQQKSFAETAPRFRALFRNAADVFTRFVAEEDTIASSLDETQRFLQYLDEDFEDFRAFIVEGGRGVEALNEEWPNLVSTYAPIKGTLSALNVTPRGNNVISFQTRTMGGLPAFVRWFGELWAGIITVGRDADGQVAYQFLKNIECYTGLNQQKPGRPISCGVRGDGEVNPNQDVEPGYPGDSDVESPDQPPKTTP